MVSIIETEARALLYPIKEKYGDALSWGDLFVVSGTAAIANMEGPIGEVCAGRIDDADGSKSNDLPFANDTAEMHSCNVDGNCTAPLGSETRSRRSRRRASARCSAEWTSTTLRWWL